MYINKLIQTAIIITLSALLFSACKSDDNSEALISDPRGEIMSSELVQSYNIAQVDSLIESYNSAEISILPRNYAVEIHNIIYQTIDAHGEPTIASGAFVIPAIDKPKALISYQHGTVIKKDDVPSRGSQELLIGIIYASNSGVAVSMPDYLGLGDSPGRHPYVHGPSQATASVDMIRASKRLAKSINVPLNDKLLLFGYSQGGHATMALTKAIEEEHSDEFTLTASAPMAGPYDMSGVQSAPFTAQVAYSNPYYLPYLLLSYNEAYGLYDNYSDFLRAPYDTTLPPLFDGTNGGGVINSAMPPIPSHIIREDIIEDFKFNYKHPFRVALQANDLWNWKPEVPMHLCQCRQDTQVFYENAEVAYRTFKELGTEDVKLVAFDGDHADCVLPCFLDALQWFNGFY